MLLCKDFGEYLVLKFDPETAQSYYKKLKSVIIRANEKGYTDVDTRKAIVSFDIDEDAINKEILEPEEVKLLEATPWSHNPKVRSAFIFSLNTGIDFDTVKTLRYYSIFR